MTWLDHYREQNDVDTQGRLFGGSDIIPDDTEPSRVKANNDLKREVKKRGGNAQTHIDVNDTIARTVLGHTTRQLAQELDVKDRSKLPTEAKEALMVGDIAARHRLVEDDAQGHEEIVESAGKGAKAARRLFPWRGDHET
jgi:hypothetical protein